MKEAFLSTLILDFICKIFAACLQSNTNPGQNNYEVLGALGVSQEEVDALEAAWAPKKK